MQFSYRALDSSGFIQKGILEVESEAAALSILQERDYAPLELKPLTTPAGRPATSSSRHIKHGEVVALIRELSTLLGSGVGLSESFTTLLEATSHRGMKEALAQLNQSVRSGERFSAALDKSALKLPQYVYALSRAGEETGDLGSALARCAEQLEFEERMRNEAKEALTYPMILIATGVAAIGFIFSFVVPRFAGILQGRKVDLPLLSQWVLGTGMYVNNHWLGLLLALLALVVAIVVAARNSRTGPLLMSALSRLPLLSEWVAGAETARWTSMLSVLLQSRVSILMSIELAAASVRLPENVTRLKNTEDDVRRGKQLSTAIEERRLLDGSSLTMLKVGEKSGQLATMLEHVTTHTTKKHRSMQRRLVALIEPISILVIGLSLGLIMAGVVLAMTSLTEIKL